MNESDVYRGGYLVYSAPRASGPDLRGFAPLGECGLVQAQREPRLVPEVHSNSDEMTTTDHPSTAESLHYKIPSEGDRIQCGVEPLSSSSHVQQQPGDGTNKGRVSAAGEVPKQSDDDERPKTIQRFLLEYRKGQLLGQGSAGTVFRVTSNVTGTDFACKAIKLDPSQSDVSLGDIAKELQMLAALSGHPSYVSFHDVFMNERHCMIVMELLGGGSLDSYVKQSRPGRLNEEDCRTVMRKILEGLAFLHELGAAHRDIKLENIMLARAGDVSSIKLVDLGLSKVMLSSKHTVCGSPLYLAPEALLQTVALDDGRRRARYDTGVDMWACGIVLYILLSGGPPYVTTGQQELRVLLQEIASCSIKYDSPVWQTVSPMALHLLKQMLNWDPHQRISAEEALSHPWLFTGR